MELTVFADGVFAIWDRALLQEMGICSINPEILNWMPVLNTEASYSGSFRGRYLLMLVISGPSVSYANQPGGVFKFDKFYKQIAVAYGLGLRLDLDFFILRFDGGMKAVNPAYETRKEHFPIIHPKFSRDFAFHFAVGYPF